jgi:primosomal protein N' (replication factor Y)
MSEKPSARALLVQVALPLPLFQTFTYAVPGEAPRPGTRVRVPFGREERIGWVTGPAREAPVRGLRNALAVLDHAPSIPDDVLRLCAWMADYYVAPPGIALRAAVPSVMTDVSRDYILARPGATDDRATPRERRVLDALSASSKPQRVSTLRKKLGMGSIWPEINGLVARSVLSHQTLPPREPGVRRRRMARLIRWLADLSEREEVFARAQRQREAYDVLESAGGQLALTQLLAQGFSRAVVAGLEARGLVELTDEEVARDPFAESGPASVFGGNGQRSGGAPTALVPTPAQAEAIATLSAALDDGARRPFLLHGVTGSGKTLVYIELLRRVLARGRSAIVLVPEISLTPQTVSRFRSQFGDQVAVLHSALSDGERFDAWRALRSGDKRIAVGARSALFAPVERLGVIVVDEEHESSYKQSEAPRYHGRDLAVVRAELAGAVCVLGSATPSLESWANQAREKFALISLPDRVGGGRLPDVEVVDLREVRKRRLSSSEGGQATEAAGGEGGVVLSETLVEAVHVRLRRTEQVILLLNRRGYSSFVQCRECGDVRACENCSIALTFHRVRHRLVCHHCRHEEDAPRRCLRCGSQDLSFRGIGTEQVERVVAQTFPGARIARMDVDTTSGKWSHHEILGRVERGEVDILLGTQMIAKGLDFPRVTLVGVVNADVGLHLPDFRASERTFQLLSQVAGRAGRGHLGGEVVIQTSLPEHHAVRAAAKHDYEGFARRELDQRVQPPYPPHVRLANVVLSAPLAEPAADAAEAAARWVREWIREADSSVEVVGPAPSPIERLHGRWRWHFLLRSGSVAELGAVARAFLTGFDARNDDVRIAFDRDPVALL